MIIVFKLSNDEKLIPVYSGILRNLIFGSCSMRELKVNCHSSSFSHLGSVG